MSVTFPPNSGANDDGIYDKGAYLRFIESADNRIAIAVCFATFKLQINMGWATLKALSEDSQYKRLLADVVRSNSFDLVKQYIISAHTRISGGAKPKTEPLRTAGSLIGLKQSFEQAYVGAAVTGLYEYLGECETEFCGDKAEYYGRITSIVQSSGTGKSRTLIELMRTKVLGLYINIRSIDEENSYPPRDTIPANILIAAPHDSAEEYGQKCIAFFTALLDVVYEELYARRSIDGISEYVILDWSREMCEIGSDRRVNFFETVQGKYDIVLRTLQSTPLLPDRSNVRSFPTQETVRAEIPLEGGIEALSFEDRAPPESSPGETAGDRERAPSNDSHGSAVIRAPELPGERTMKEAYDRLRLAAPRFFDGPSASPKLVIAFDEAHELSTPNPRFHPSHILNRVISSLTIASPGGWVVFASTVSKVIDFSAPSHMHYSLRISRGGKELFPPFSQFGWDQLARPMGNVDPQDVARLENIVGFGRPLWKSLRSSGLPMNEILLIASQKLCYATTFKATDTTQVFAVLGQRFCLDVCFGHLRAVELQANAVAGHLRVCVSTTDDRLWQTTTYPSEPILSCAASGLLHKGWQNNRSPLIPCLRQLSLDVVAGLIDVGRKGELVSRLIYLLAKDLCVRDLERHAVDKLPQSRNPGTAELLDCRMVPVTSYLKFVFGKQGLPEGAEALLRDWYINFSHWVAMDKAIGLGSSSDEPNAQECLLRCWIRTSALQCCHTQKAIDKLIPMYKKPVEGAKPSEPSMSYILISDRARRSQSKGQLNSVTPQQAGFPAQGTPYVAILADMRSKSDVLECELREADQSLRIYAPGVKSDIYHFLMDESMSPAQDVLENILDPPEPHQHGSVCKSLASQVAWGASWGEIHMRWEIGREPDGESIE